MGENDYIRFGLDVLMEQDTGASKDFEAVVEEVELCGLPSLPDNWNGPGYIHPLNGFSLDHEAKFRLTELLNGA